MAQFSIKCHTLKFRIIVYENNQDDISLSVGEQYYLFLFIILLTSHTIFH